MFAYCAGLLLLAASIGSYELTDKAYMHSGGFYRITATLFTLLLIAPARVIFVMKWPATAAAVYMAFSIALTWTLQLVPAEPKLGPIFQHVTHMVGLSFPMLLVAPALAMDLVMQRLGKNTKWWLLAPALAIVFVGVFLAVQWPFGSFLMTPSARNWIFNADNYVYWMPPTSLRAAHVFAPASATPLAVSLALALVQATFACALGLAWGSWMQRVRR